MITPPIVIFFFICHASTRVLERASAASSSDAMVAGGTRPFQSRGVMPSRDSRGETCFAATSTSLVSNGMARCWSLCRLMSGSSTHSRKCSTVFLHQGRWSRPPEHVHPCPLSPFGFPTRCHRMTLPERCSTRPASSSQLRRHVSSQNFRRCVLCSTLASASVYSRGIVKVFNPPTDSQEKA
jgi:hypothetical protein